MRSGVARALEKKVWAEASSKRHEREIGAAVVLGAGFDFGMEAELEPESAGAAIAVSVRSDSGGHLGMVHWKRVCVG